MFPSNGNYQNVFRTKASETAPSPRRLTASLVRGLSFFLLGRGAVSVAGAEGLDRLEGAGYGGRRGGSDSRRVSVRSHRSPQLQRPLGEPSVRARAPSGGF
ncbi:unnamed protein product [Pleuronectes platessa]|uniref:Uncharacterized protein n=1 Tax=Pleuronectes platessa TaxID=8262 RepID=A0A9N7VH69_PLEPL|nr:unnamed protein product [Pleuronectes platessa]